jgi:hypothetical protein
MKDLKYISGKYALNIVTPDMETCGDWHGFIWDIVRKWPDPKVTIAGNGERINTNSVYADYGIYEGGDILRKMGIESGSGMIYIANHYRALLDLVYASIARYGKVLNLAGATDDFLSTEEQKKIFLNMTNKMETMFDSRERKAALVHWVWKEKNISRKY